MKQKTRFDIKKVKRAKELRKRGLSYREIMRAMGKNDTKTIYRWLRYELPCRQLSTGRDLTA